MKSEIYYSNYQKLRIERKVNMKRLLISLIALQLTACLSGGSGGSPVATIALAPEEPSEPVVPPADPGPAPTQPSFNQIGRAHV